MVAAAGVVAATDAGSVVMRPPGYEPPFPMLSAPEQALAALGDALALIDADAGRCEWTSPAWQARLRGVEWPALWCALGPAIALAQRQGSGSADIEWLGASGGVVRARTEVAIADAPGRLAVRLGGATASAGADSATSQASRRHLEDRERLLFTSRSISIGEMAATLAHEINQPIGTVTNVLRGMLAWLEQREPGVEGSPVKAEDADPLAELRQGVRLALDQALFAARIVGRIRDYTQSRQPAREPVDVLVLLRDSVGLLDWEIARDGVAAVLALAEPELPARVLGDAVMLQQVIVNLLRNSLDALRDTPEGQRRIVVRTRRHDAPTLRSQIEIEVRDNGCGLSAEDEQRLFVPFQSTKPTGMGLGLNICRSFIELHQGRLWFTRAPAGESGCSFHVELPLM